MKLSLGRSKRSLYVEIVDILTYEVSAELVEFQRHPRLFKLRKGGEGVNENIFKYFFVLSSMFVYKKKSKIKMWLFLKGAY